MYTKAPMAAPRALELLPSKALTMHVTPSTTSTATTGMDASSKFARTVSPVPEEVACVADSVVALEEAVADSVCEVDLVAVAAASADPAVGLAAEVDSVVAATAILPAVAVVAASAMLVVLLVPLLLLRIRLRTTLLLVASAAKSSTSAT